MISTTANVSQIRSSNFRSITGACDTIRSHQDLPPDSNIIIDEGI